MPKTLDALDRQLLALLAADARSPLTTLAKAIGLSRSATQERLQRLEDSGVILGYAVRLRWSPGEEADAWLMLRLASGVTCDAVVPRILALPGVELCHALAGPLDLLVRVRRESTEAVSQVRDTLAALEGVESVTTHVVLAHHR
ncbi:MAG: Lrp/AsnC family transcriptional regulator [Rhizobacter sp.]|nr:Lrp/AsnC family transcriptional regulator [Rhizobacter sp.]